MFAYVRNVILFKFRMDNEVNRLRKKLELELDLVQKRCEYCDWNPTCCEWCGKLKNNRRKAISSGDNIEKKRSSSM